MNERLLKIIQKMLSDQNFNKRFGQTVINATDDDRELFLANNEELAIKLEQYYTNYCLENAPVENPNAKEAIVSKPE